MVHYQQRDGVALLIVDNPPVNALSPGVPEALQAAVERANEDPQVNSIAVMGAGRTFMAGADIKEITKPDIRAYLKSLLDCARAMEDSAKPVVMAIHGTAFGAGLEIAMGGHYRILLASAQVGQPEVKLGLIPGAGGTQRLPRLVGIEHALEMCVSGEPVSAQKALEIGLVDEIFLDDVAEAAVKAGQKIAGKHYLKTREKNDPLQNGVERVRKWLSTGRLEAAAHQVAPTRAAAAVAAATMMTFDAGIREEARQFEECRQGPQAKALIHLFFAERNAAKAQMAETAAPAGPFTVTNLPPAVLNKSEVICFERSGSRLCEIIRAPEAPDGAVKSALDHAKTRGLVAVVVREAVSERLLRRLHQEQEACLREGAPEADVQGALAGKGWRSGGMVTKLELLPDPVGTRIIKAMADEGAQILAEGHALRASDIDVISVLGCGFPAWRGGVMFYAAALTAAG